MLTEMISFEKVGSVFLRVRFIEHLVIVLSVCVVSSLSFLNGLFFLFRVRILQ